MRKQRKIKPLLNRFTIKATEDNITFCDYKIISEVPRDEEYMQQYANNKLGEIENIEEELGVEIITLYKALKPCFITIANYYKEHEREILERQKND